MRMKFRTSGQSVLILSAPQDEENLVMSIYREALTFTLYHRLLSVNL